MIFHAGNGGRLESDEKQKVGRHAEGYGQYLMEADFWNRTLQNWQSELLAVASTAILPIFLRQRGSPQSEPVGTPHSATGVEG